MSRRAFARTMSFSSPLPQIRAELVGAPRLDTRFGSEDAWTVANVAATLGPHFAKLWSIADGFTVKPT